MLGDQRNHRALLERGWFAFAVGWAWTAGFLLSKLTDFAGTGYAAFTMSMGVVVTIALRFPKRGPEIVGGVLLSNVIMSLVISRPLRSPVIAGFINGGEALLIAHLLRRFASSRFERATNAVVLAAAAVVGAAAAATVATLILGPLEGRNLVAMWCSWLSADVLGVILVVPVLEGVSLKRPPTPQFLTLLGAVLLAGALGRIAVPIASGEFGNANVFLEFLPWYGLVMLAMLAGVEFGAMGLGLTQLPAALAIFATHPATDITAWLERVALTTILSVSMQAAVLAIRRQVLQREASQEVTRTLFELSPEPSAQVHVDSGSGRIEMRLTQANKAMRELLGSSADDWRGADLASFIQEDDVAAVQEALKRKGGTSIEVRLCKRGRRTERICRLSATTAHAAESGESAVIVVLTDVTEHRRAVDRLELQARRDALTGLLNRRAFLEELQRLLRSPGREQFGLVFVDVDNLKTINDERGHRAGDLALRATAMRIERTLRVGDIAGRYGGDEFLVAVQVSDTAALEALRERIDLTLSTPLVSDAIDVAMSCSVGSAMALADDDLEQLLQRADADMYARKAARKDVRRSAD